VCTNQSKNPPRTRQRVNSEVQGVPDIDKASSSDADYIANPVQSQASPQVEILIDPPLSIKRPLVLLDGQAYAVSILDFQITKKDDADSKGKIYSHKPSKSRVEQQLVIVRGDGGVFADIPDGRFSKLDDLGIQLELPELPHRDKLWSPQGVMKFLVGYRPVPIEVFRKLTEVVDTFIDFDHSLADQETMTEFIALYVLSTWFLDAFNVIGFLWPNGERGSGKTNLLILISELGYLGQLILAGGSYASLRDMADCGATLCFDDAENLSDPKQSDPDKRALLLAGNRRGAYVSLKEPTKNKGWQTRYVNTFCARAFSAIRLPDSVLSSRSIIVPLIRTTDRKRANIDPADYSSWPYEHHELLDDLWALATASLPDLKPWDDWVGQNSKLTGRNLQPWRSVLGVAAWLEAMGVEGLWGRMEELAVSYQSERLNIETSDFTVLVIRAIIRCAKSAISAVSAIEKERTKIILPTMDVVRKAHDIIDEEDADLTKDIVTPRSVGRVMAKLRLPEVPRPGGQGHRRRSITLKELSHIAQSHEIPLPDELQADAMQATLPDIIDGTSGSTGTNGAVVTAKQISVNDLIKSSPYPNTSKPCFACKDTNWKLHQDGKTSHCGTCHPTRKEEEKLTKIVI